MSHITGPFNLKVVAQRKAGFKAPITVLPLVNIPGVGAASAVTIAEGQNETLLPMNAERVTVTGSRGSASPPGRPDGG